MKKFAVLSTLLVVALLAGACAQPTAAPTEPPPPPPPPSGLPDLGGRQITVAVENAYLPFNYIDPRHRRAGWLGL